MKKIKFTIPGPPQGKGRPRFSRRGKFVTTFTPDKTILYENLVRMEYQRQCGTERFGDDVPLKMRVTAYFAIPKSASKTKRADMINGAIMPTKKPDADNVLKIVADSLNQYAYPDDVQIVFAAVTKIYDLEPRVEVMLESVV